MKLLQFFSPHQVALQLALSCSSRHYAGRSFQILRALQIRPSTSMLSDILSRLVETVAEQGEDMQVKILQMLQNLSYTIQIQSHYINFDSLTFLQLRCNIVLGIKFRKKVKAHWKNHIWWTVKKSYKKKNLKAYRERREDNRVGKWAENAGSL